MSAEGRRVTLRFVGDMMFDTRLLPPRMFFRHEEDTSCSVDKHRTFALPYVNDDENRRWVLTHGCPVASVVAASHVSQSIALAGVPESLVGGYPFEGVGKWLQGADIAFANLECPLSLRGRPMANDACYRADPSVAQSLADAGISVVSFANNHAMDYGEVAFGDTLCALKDAGVQVVGAGTSLAEASRPIVFETNGIKIAFLAYTMVGENFVYAGHSDSGVCPLNPRSVSAAVDSIRLEADCVVVSVHWGWEGMSRPGTHLVRLAHRLIECGADLVVGHHSHVPASIETYEGKVILYSLGNFCFGHSHAYWKCGLGASVRVGLDGVMDDLEIVPFDVGAQNAGRPRLADAVLARGVHERLAQTSRALGTELECIDRESTLWRASGTGRKQSVIA